MTHPRLSKWFSGSAYIPVSNHDHEERDAGMTYKDEEGATTEQAHLGSSSKPASREITAPSGVFASFKNATTSLTVNGLMLLGVLCLLGFIIALAVPSAHHSHASLQRPPKHHPHGMQHHEAQDRPKQVPHVPQCGSTPVEAKTRSCLFEQQLGAWVPQACAWKEIVDEFLDVVGDIYTEWSWFWDTDLKREVNATSIPELQNGNFSVVYTTYPRAHDLHCLYCWRKVEYALEHGVRWMDARCHQFWHTKHCVSLIEETLTDQAEEHRGLTYPLLYHDCVPLTSTKES